MLQGCKKCRREGEKLLLKGDRCLSQKCALVKRSYAPGQHISSGSKKLSEYGRQLREKQKIKRIYGLNESIIKKYYDLAERSRDKTTEKMISLIETRLDNVVYRSGLCPSRSAARQLVSHGKVFVNNKRVTVASYILSPNDQIKFHKDINAAKLSSRNITWFEINKSSAAIIIKKIPSRAELEININENLVVDYYSR